jgi:hypothetical protein
MNKNQAITKAKKLSQNGRFNFVVYKAGKGYGIVSWLFAKLNNWEYVFSTKND